MKIRVTFSMPQNSEPARNILVKFASPTQTGGDNKSHLVKLIKIAAIMGPPVNKIKPITQGSKYRYGTIDSFLKAMTNPFLLKLKGDSARIPL
ncbi:MAG TPA: hypothetical protein PLB53_05955 [Candidatus Atribacteria bacterium]|jgi:hypothetical protein|nr:hypothetical protein [Candidatus Atribacteria bacterium]